MRKIYFLVFFTIYNTYNSQIQSISNRLTNIVSASPQLYNMVQYGNQPLNEYSGMAQINIPITEIKEHDIYNSISLKYSKLGVKVNELPSNVGVSWLLEMGGVITRTIYDLPDEKQAASNRLIFNGIMDFANIPYLQNGSSDAIRFNSYIKDENIDNEVDIFNISVGGLNGSFYLNKDLKPVMLENNYSFKIDAIGDFSLSHQFLLTSNTGIKYYFGGTNAIEETWNRDNIQYKGITAFYLTKIENQAGESINFAYTDVGGKAFNLSKQEQRVISTSIFTNCTNPIRGVGQASYIAQNNILRINNAKVISRITGSNTNIIINYQNNENTIYDRIISLEISVKGKNHQLIEFEYLDKFNAGYLERFFLTKVKRFNYQNSQKIFDSEHIFEYNNPLDLPARNAYSVDVFGYYNGKFNSTLIPDLNLLSDNSYNLGAYSFADRRSVFSNAMKGTLKSIIYPTKGKTSFEYEAIPQKKITNETISKLATTEELPNIIEQTALINGTDVIDNIIAIRINISQEITSAIPNQMGHANFKIIDVSNNSILESKTLILSRNTPDDEGPASKDLLFYFNTDPNKQYKFILTLLRPNLKYKADYTAVYKKGYEKVYESGLRLKKIFDDNGSNNIKRIYYSSIDDINNINKLPEHLYNPSAFLSSGYDISGCYNNSNGTPALYPKSLQQTIISSQRITDYIEGENYKTPTYPIITISYGGDNFETGGEEKKFSSGNYDENIILNTGNTSDYYGNDLSSLIGTLNVNFQRDLSLYYYNGKLLENKIFRKAENGQLFLQKKNSYTYDVNNYQNIYNLTGKEIYGIFGNPAGTDPNSMMSNLYLNYYPRKSYSVLLLQKIEKEYFEDILYNVTDDLGYKKQVKTTFYSYDNPAHFQLTKEKTTDPESVISETIYSYAHEKGNQLMIDKNMIGIPLETTNTQTIGTNTKTLSKVETIYPVSQSEANTKSSGLVLPLSVKSYDLQNTESTEVTYNQYDSKGNLLQYTTKDGIPTAIIWGYNSTQPIAKVTGATYAQVGNLALAIIAASDSDASNPANETALFTALDSFRKLPALQNAQITTYTYDPLIGVTSITPPSGIREVYLYDTANRLKEIRENNASGKILKEFKYNYKP